MSTITHATPVSASILPPPSSVSDLIDTSETLYRLSVEEYERIGEIQSCTGWVRATGRVRARLGRSARDRRRHCRVDRGRRHAHLS
jgi:hypothetical protein